MASRVKNQKRARLTAQATKKARGIAKTVRASAKSKMRRRRASSVLGGEGGD
jgi:hypothetical protein